MTDSMFAVSAAHIVCSWLSSNFCEGGTMCNPSFCLPLKSARADKDRVLLSGHIMKDFYVGEVEIQSEQTWQEQRGP